MLQLLILTMNMQTLLPDTTLAMNVHLMSLEEMKCHNSPINCTRACYKTRTPKTIFKNPTIRQSSLL